MKSILSEKHLLILLLLSVSCTSRYPGPLSPEKALESFELREGFRIELFARNPCSAIRFVWSLTNREMFMWWKCPTILTGRKTAKAQRKNYSIKGHQW